MGFEPTGKRVGEWVVDPHWWSERRQQMMTAVKRWSADHDIAAGMPLETLRQQVELPAAELVAGLLDGTGLEVADGRVRPPNTGLPARVDKSLRMVEQSLAAEPFRAPGADELKELNLGPKELAAAIRAGRLTKVAEGVVLGPEAVQQAAAILRTLPQPFTVSDARRALRTTRRVAVPLLELLDTRRITRRCDSSTRQVV